MDEQKTEKTKAAKVIQADKVEGTMKGMKLKVGVSNDMAPFSYYDSEQKKITGFDIDLLDKLSEYLGFEYELYPMNMKKLEQKIKNKELDLAIAGISITDERQRELFIQHTKIRIICMFFHIILDSCCIINRCIDRSFFKIVPYFCNVFIICDLVIL